MKTLNLWRVVLFSILSVFAFAACSDDEETPPVQTEVTLNVNGETETTVGLTNEAGAVVTVAVDASAKWNLTMESDWCSANVVSGEAGQSEIQFTAASALPEKVESREAVAKLSAKGNVLGFEYTKTATITIVQTANGEVPDITEPLPEGVATIKELVTRGRAGVKYTVKEAVVVANEFRGSVIGDDSGAFLFVYGMKAPFKVGDKISIEGPLQVMWGVPQFSLPGREPNPAKDATATVLGQGQLNVEYKAMSKEEIAKYKALETPRDIPTKLAYPVTFEGTVSKYKPEGDKYDIYEMTTTSGDVLTLEYVGNREMEPLVGQKTTIKGFTVGDEGTTKHGNLKVIPVLTTGSTPDPTPTPTPGGEGTLSYLFENGVKGTSYTINEATIVAKGETAFVLGDATGFMMVYGSTDLALNDKVTAEGPFDVFWGVGQFKSQTAKFTKTGTNNWTYNSKGMSDEEISSYFAISTEDRNKASKPCKEVTFTGTLSKVEEQGSKGPKTIYELAIDGQTSKVAITYCNDLAAQFVDKKVTVKGYTVGDEKNRLKVLPYEMKAEGGVTPEPTPGDAVKIGDIKAVGTYTVNNAVVVNVSEIATVLADETGYILVYGNSTNAMGDKVNISGEVSNYRSKSGEVQGVYQFDARTATVEKVSAGNTMTVNYEAYDKTKVENYINNFEAQFLACRPIELKGELIQSGKYYNLNIDGLNSSDMCGAIQYMTPDASAVGKKVTIKGYAVGWNGSKEAGKTSRIKIFPNTITVDGEGGGETPNPEPQPVAGKYNWDANLMADVDTNNKSSKDKVTSLNGESNVEVIKLGSGKNAGVYTTNAVGVTGDKTLSFYSGAWSGKKATLYIRVDNGGEANPGSVAVKGNAGFTGNQPYKEVTLTEEDHYTVKLTGLTAASTITFSTSADFNTVKGDEKETDSRAVLIGVHLE